MAFINCTFFDFEKNIKNQNKKIICYGAGMIPLYIERILSQYDLCKYITLFVDSNMQKKGQCIVYNNRNIAIEHPSCLNAFDSEEYVILITAEKYQEIQSTLEQYIDLSKWQCYMYPLLNLSLFNSLPQEKINFKEVQCIPKIIHYTWFGKNEKKELHQRCIDSWKRCCPDYEIIEWNESNYNIEKNKYISQAYNREKWAYVSDYARLDILYHWGGIYLDTDVELISSLDKLLNWQAFICFGEWPAPNSGAGIGCIKGNEVIRDMMRTRENIPFIQSDGSNDKYTNSNYEMIIMEKYGFHMNHQYQENANMVILPADFIAPTSGVGINAFVTKRTLGMHYCNNSWRKEI